MGPPPDQVFLMKLSAARAPDFSDMVALWPRCSFRDSGEVVNQFYGAYPNEEPDPHLGDYVQTVISTLREVQRHKIDVMRFAVLPRDSSASGRSDLPQHRPSHPDGQ